MPVGVFNATGLLPRKATIRGTNHFTIVGRSASFKSIPILPPDISCDTVPALQSLNSDEGFTVGYVNQAHPL